MRIIAGEFKGRLINAPSGRNTRPTLDKVREAIFSIIQFNVDKCVFLDLFSGSGAIGIEAISRGASKVVFNDYDNRAISVIKDNIQSLKIDSNQYEILNNDYYKTLSILKQKEYIFDIVFLDPPYEEKINEEIIEYLITNKMLSDYCIIIIESDSSYNIKNTFGLPLKEYKYGLAKLTIMKKA
ncbi:MAG: 16S rRNA (guanine(966)-N(2))-methyltransferase RsmD [Bacilli bacterium]|nr:16S rRNA (guanine(966)-N(2))-methyltransferase RsmD [Bacilli bacterium]